MEGADIGSASLSVTFEFPDIAGAMSRIMIVGELRIERFKGHFTYGWDYHNRLASVNVVKWTPSGEVTIEMRYAYDVLGNRIARIVNTSGTQVPRPD